VDATATLSVEIKFETLLLARETAGSSAKALLAK